MSTADIGEGLKTGIGHQEIQTPIEVRGGRRGVAMGVIDGSYMNTC